MNKSIIDIEVIYNYLIDPESIDEETIKLETKKLGLLVKEANIRREYTDKINEVVSELDSLNKEEK